MLIAELTSLFSSANIAEGHLTAITLSQKSKNDMTCWTPEVEAERDDLIEKVKIWSMMRWQVTTIDELIFN